LAKTFLSRRQVALPRGNKTELWLKIKPFCRNSYKQSAKIAQIRLIHILTCRDFRVLSQVQGETEYLSEPQQDCGEQKIKVSTKRLTKAVFSSGLHQDQETASA